MNYTQIKAAVLAWLHDSSAEVTALIDTFILLAEARLNRDLEAGVLLNKTTGTFSETIPYPSDFSAIVSLHKVFSTNIYVPVLPMTLTAIHEGGQGYCLTKDGIQVSPYMTGSYELAYNANLLSIITNTTNDIATSHPDLYIYATLIEACSWSRDEKEPDFIAKYQDILTSVNLDETKLGQSLGMRSDFNVP